MIAERNLLVSILKLTKDGPGLTKDVKMDAHLPSDLFVKLLEELQNENLLEWKDAFIEVGVENRLKLAAKAISRGADIESVSNLLQWQEFESISAAAFEKYNFAVRQNLRFKRAARRWEIDIVGCKKPLAVCVDCKSWHHSISPSAMKRVVKSQVERTRALSDALPSLKIGLECCVWSRVKFVPVVLVLVPSTFKFFDEVPVVPVLQLSDFLSNLPLEVENLEYFTKEFSHLRHDSY